MKRSRVKKEADIFREICAAILLHGYYINLDTGENYSSAAFYEKGWEFPKPGSRDLRLIVDACYGVDSEGRLYAYADEWQCEIRYANGGFAGEIFCVSGQGQYELCVDYSGWLDEIIKPIISKHQGVSLA